MWNTIKINVDERNFSRALYSPGLETVETRVKAAQSEAKIMSEYRNVVEMADRHLELELSSIENLFFGCPRPGIDCDELLMKLDALQKQNAIGRD